MSTRAVPEDIISADSDPPFPGVGRSYSVVWTAMSKVVLTLPAVTMHVCSVNIAGMVTLAILKSSEELKDGRLCQDEGFPDITLMLALPWQGAIYWLPCTSNDGGMETKQRTPWGSSSSYLRLSGLPYLGYALVYLVSPIGS